MQLLSLTFPISSRRGNYYTPVKTISEAFLELNPPFNPVGGSLCRASDTTPDECKMGTGTFLHWQTSHRDTSEMQKGCLLYTSDAADDLLCVDLGGRRT